MSNTFKTQSAEDFEKIIEKFRRSYAPEWKFDPKNPDAGTVIAQIFARQMEENNRLMTRMPERYHIEFVNMLDTTLRSAKPSSSMVVFNMDTDTIIGTSVPKGTRLAANSDETDSGYLIYETDRNLYVTESKIRSVFMTDSDNGTITPIYGEFNPPEILSGTISSIASDDMEEIETDIPDETTEDATEERMTIPPFSLFGEKRTIGRSVLTMYEPRLFDGNMEPIYVRFEGGSQVVEKILNGDLTFKYFTDKGFEKFDKMEILADNKTFMLLKSKDCRKVKISGKDYSVVVLESEKTMTGSLEISDVSISAGGNRVSPDYVGDGILELNPEKFKPFSDTMAVYNECYIGNDHCFSKSGATITLDFKVTYHENILKINPEQEGNDLAIIKAKPRKMTFEVPAEVKVNEVIIEYYNGIGWKKLQCDAEYAGMFENCESGEYKLKFTCPDDFMVSESGPYMGRCLRMRIVRSDNCYMRPAVHTYPIIEKLRISFSYEGRFVHPARLERIFGTTKEDITEYLGRNKPFTAFSGSTYHEDALYIGLDKKLVEGPISLYFQLSDASIHNSAGFSVEYSSPLGFSKMKITDLTESFTKSGSVMFMPPSDMVRTNLEGNRLFWLKIKRNRKKADDFSDVFLPYITMMCLNAVTVTNLQTSEEMDYYIDEVIPDRSISLGVSNVLDAKVFVNEMGFVSKEEIDMILQNDPERVRTEYDFLGRLLAVYIQWDETESFDSAPHKRCYRIDRMDGTIIFSDGNKCEMPRVLDDIAFKAVVRSTDGEKGNLGVGEITSFTEAAPYIESVFNPIRAIGGSNLETLDHAMERCAGVINSRHRLVTESDFVRFVMEFNDSIDRCKVVVGENRDGESEEENNLSIVLLMKDYADGSFSFHRMSNTLKRDIYKKCVVTVTPDTLHIVEPIFVYVSVNVWTMVVDLDDAFDVQSEIKSILKGYLEPIRKEGHEGWDIGTLPKETQILMKLSSLRNKSMIQRITMTGKYVDYLGEHELDVKDIEISPFMVVRSGEHKVYITDK